MRILHFVSGLQSGGVEQMLYNYTKILNKKDYEQVIVYQHSPDMVNLEKLKSANNTCIEISSKSKHPIKNLLQTKKIITEFHPDIIHTHMNLVNFIPLMVAFFCGVKVRISHSHISRDNVKFRLFVPVFKLLNIIFSNTRFACGQDAGKYMYGNLSFTVVNNALDLSKFQFSQNIRNNLRRKWAIPENAYVIGHIGRFVNQKNHKKIIDIFEACYKKDRNTFLVLVGQGELYIEIKNMIKEKSFENNIIMTGSLDNVFDYYSLFDVFLLPSLYEGLPVVALEAQAAGLPSIFSNVIDKDVKLLPSTTFISLQSSTSVWVNSIFYQIKQPRIDFNSIERLMSDKGYNIYEEYHKIDKLYRKLLMNR